MATESPPAAAPEPRANPDLIGHRAAELALLGAVRSGRLGHAWLLHGPRGIGKATLAYRFARYLLAGGGGEGSSLAVDRDSATFRHVAHGTHPDLSVLEVATDHAKRAKAEIPVDAVRAVTEAMHTTAAGGGRRVVVVDGVEALNRNAANALLKLLEEPPGGAVLLLVSHELGRVPATIRSRCALLRLRPLTEEEVRAGLAGLCPDLPAADAAALARIARGSLGRALMLATTGWLPLYQRLVGALAAGGGPSAVAERHALALELARLAEGHGGTGTVAALLQEVLARATAASLGRLGPPLFAGEAAALAELAAAAPLDQWGRLWDKLARLPDRVDGLSLDRVQSLSHILSLFPTAARGPSHRPGGAPISPPGNRPNVRP